MNVPVNYYIAQVVNPVPGEIQCLALSLVFIHVLSIFK
jgi:hypothetical protein